MKNIKRFLEQLLTLSILFLMGETLFRRVIWNQRPTQVTLTYIVITFSLTLFILLWPYRGHWTKRDKN